MMERKAVMIADTIFLLKEGARTIGTLLVEPDRRDELLKLLEVKEVIENRKNQWLKK